jgi:hypothetical protein
MTSANIRTCTVCQKKFERPKRKKDAARCCSRECGFKWLARNKGKDTPRSALGMTCFMEYRPCRHCGSVFQARQKDKQCCSVECVRERQRFNTAIAGDSCIECGAKREFYSQRCAPCRENAKKAARKKTQEARRNSESVRRCKKAYKAKRRAKGRDVISAPVSLADVIKAHGKRCHLCGKAVDINTANQPKSATMDHVVPLALGGWHDLNNLRPAHQLCNSIKGARFTGQLMLTC